MNQKLVIKVAQGELLGKLVVDDCSKLQYYSFQGIPYAKPPVGELRFKAPQPPESWSGIRDATVEGNECFSHHLIFRHLVGSEDCLFLNVYTPSLPCDEKSLKPVMVWIHGGGFVNGSGNSDIYGPEFLLPHNVVVVTINYRTGLFGFINFENPEIGVPGNAGLKDQVMALKWIQNNITNFNGDPNNVTLFGESAGGASVHYMMLSPMCKGLFHKAIIQSGSALASWAQGDKSGHLIAKALKLEKVDELEIINILKNMTSEEIINVQTKIPDLFITCEMRPIGPVVEKVTNEPAFITEEPIDIIASGRYYKVPMIIGYCNREGMFIALSTKMRYKQVKLTTKFETIVPYMLKVKMGSEVSKDIAAKIKNFYYGDEEPSMENIDQYYLLHTDNVFFRNIHSTVKNHVESSSMPVYLYRFSTESNLNLFKKAGKITHSGVCHGDEIGYLFKSAVTPEIRPGSVEDDAIQRMTTLWTNFARYGNPNLKTHNPLIDITWKPAEENVLNFIDIGENLTAGVNPEYSRMKFWDTIYSRFPHASKL